MSRHYFIPLSRETFPRVRRPSLPFSSFSPPSSSPPLILLALISVASSRDSLIILIRDLNRKRPLAPPSRIGRFFCSGRDRSGPSISRLSFAVNLPGLLFEAIRPERSELPLADCILPLRIIEKTSARLASFRCNKLLVRPTMNCSKNRIVLSLFFFPGYSFVVLSSRLMRLSLIEILDILYIYIAVHSLEVHNKETSAMDETNRKIASIVSIGDFLRDYCLPLGESSSHDPLLRSHGAVIPLIQNNLSINLETSAITIYDATVKNKMRT